MEEFKSKNVLYIILQYNFKQNLYDIVDNLFLFAFSYCALSHKNIFKIFVQYKENYILAFPSRIEELNLILNCKYEDIKSIVNRRIEDFFQIYDNISNSSGLMIALNQIFKKILLENNRMNTTKINKPTSILLNSLDKSNNLHRTRVLICSDAVEEADMSFDQKLLFLMKRQNIYVDCLSIGESDAIINKLQAAAYYTDGLYQHITNTEALSQTLLQLFFPMPEDRINTKTIFSYQTSEKSKLLFCSDCGTSNDSFILLSDVREINCWKCYKEKSIKNK